MANKSNSENLIQVTMNEQQIKHNILLNTLKMLIARESISSDNLHPYHESLIRNLNQNDETFIQLSQSEATKFNANELAIKFIGRKITTIKKVTDIETFLEKPAYKIVIVSNMQQKAIKQVLEYVNVELFKDHELKINLIDHVLVPQHRKLNPTEIAELKNSYLITEKDSKRMYIDDPVARYYNLQVGDFVEIKRPSINSGYAIDYRCVVDLLINK